MSNPDFLISTTTCEQNKMILTHSLTCFFSFLLGHYWDNQLAKSRQLRIQLVIRHGPQWKMTEYTKHVNPFPLVNSGSKSISIYHSELLLQKFLLFNLPATGCCEYNSIHGSIHLLKNALLELVVVAEVERVV